MRKIETLEVKIVKMKESSGNEQFYVRLVRTDVEKSFFSTHNILEHSCWQTKNLTKEECLNRSWFDASYLARFVGLKNMDEVIIVGLEEEEEKILKESLALKF